MLRRNHFALVPPLHLPQATLGNVGNVTARVGASPIFALRTSFLCFEHDPPLTFWMWTASKILTDLLPAFNRKNCQSLALPASDELYYLQSRSEEHTSELQSLRHL